MGQECVTDRFYANSNHAALRRRRIQMLRQPNKTTTVAGANDATTVAVNVAKLNQEISRDENVATHKMLKSYHNNINRSS